MNRLWTSVLIGVAVTAVSQQRFPPRRGTTPIMIAAVSRDKFMLNAITVRLIGADPWTREGTVAVEPMGHLTPSGEWSGLPCSNHTEDTATGPKDCLAFARRYLSKSHLYTVISADGGGAVVQAAPTDLDDCYGYTGTGTYSGAVIRRFAIAASSAEFFAKSEPPRPLNYAEDAAVLKALKALVPKGLDTKEELRLFAVRLQGHDMIVVQRAFPDVAYEPGGDYKLVFGIGTLQGGRFHLIRWQDINGDDQEAMLGTITLKNGRQFLITVVSDPESSYFRVYGIRAGRLTMVYTGGGSSC